METAGNTGARLVSQERERSAEVRELGILTALAPCKRVLLAFMTCWSIVQPLGRRWSSTSGGQSTPRVGGPPPSLRAAQPSGPHTWL